MGADEDVDLSLLNFLDNFLLLLGSAKAADHLDSDWESGEAALECLEMLKRQHGCRREHGYLAIVLHGFECSAHSNLGLSIADIAAEQTVHGHARFHVLLDVDD